MTAQLVKPRPHVRAGTPPPPSSERASMRAAAKHGPYSYGHPAPDTLPPAVVQQIRREVQEEMPAPVRMRFIAGLAFALTVAVFYFVR